MRHTPIRYTPVRYTPMRHPPIRCTLVECMPVRYVPIFENGFVVLDAERGLARMSVLAAAGFVANWGAPESFRKLRCVHRAAKEPYIYDPRRSPVKRKPTGTAELRVDLA
jgi:hypothetical protein